MLDRRTFSVLFITPPYQYFPPMQQFRSTKIGSALVFSLIAGMIVLGGCTADTLTGPTPEDEEVTVQQTTQNQDAPQSTDDGSTDTGDGHNQSAED